VPRKCKANSEALVMHIGRMLTCVLRHMQDILSSIEMGGPIQYNHLVNSIATLASIVQNRVNQCIFGKNNMVVRLSFIYSVEKDMCINFV